MVYRIYVEKRPEVAVEAGHLLAELRTQPGADGLTGVRVLNRYDVEGISPELFARSIGVVFSEPQLDFTYDTLPTGADAVLGVEYLPGQFDQRADSAAECVQLLSQGERPVVRTAKIYLLSGSLGQQALAAIEKYLINPVEARRASLKTKETLASAQPQPQPVETLTGFCAMDAEARAAFAAHWGLAMDDADLAFCQQYFAGEQREPTVTELRVIDTYWSDHCRHTTFGTLLDEVKIEDETVNAAWQRYLALRRGLLRTKPVTLMDVATCGMRALRAAGRLPDLDESEEINACTVKIKIRVDGRLQDWLLLFKNETHNHPTEIEPFGGAATCIGGAIRDPLSGRSYVYQAMRVTGAADPLRPLQETLPGKLPQRKLVTTAAAGYSSYGNQIGLATGLVDEVYHPGYAAKRMEIGAVLGATPAANVRREVPKAGDVVVLLGGRTGRDGIGGATGSSKAHTAESLETCGAEVQKGNAPIERRLQRLFRDGAVTRLIKRCNDFGAGGVAVAIGELADGLTIDLDAVPKKYDGLGGTELAISESQERMAVVLAPADLDEFLAAATAENLEATTVAVVTETPRMVMHWQGQTVVDLSRQFLSSNGAQKHTRVEVGVQTLTKTPPQGDSLQQKLAALVGDLNVCSKKGLAERFDSTIGAATVLMPFGGARQLTPAQLMAAKLPVLEGETDAASGMAYGFAPEISDQSPYYGAYLAVTESIAKLVAGGFSHEKAYLTFQEYFERLGEDPTRWGKPLASLLGALDAQMCLGVASIGGKDSMSGSFEALDVPPTLVSFAVAMGTAEGVLSPEFKQPGSTIALLAPTVGEGFLPDPQSQLAVFSKMQALARAGRLRAAWAVGWHGAAEGLFKMCLGNRLGVELDNGISPDQLFRCGIGSFLLELAPGDSVGERLGEVSEEYVFAAAGERIALDKLQQIWEDKLEPVFPYHTGEARAVQTLTVPLKTPLAGGPSLGGAKPRVLIPVFPGTNCEYDTARAVQQAGGRPQILVVNNLTPAHVAESAAALAKAIGQSQIIVLPGGFSGGDEPDGSGKFITALFRAPAIAEEVTALLQQRDGLMLGICNGFQALIKLGLLPFGQIQKTDAGCPTLTYNTIGRHQSMLVRTRISSSGSPWLSHTQPGEIYSVAISHGEGRFVANEETLRRLAENGQIAAQYVDEQGRATMQPGANPNGSALAVEALLSPDGRVLGKMGHNERCGEHLYRNVPGEHYQPIFEGGIGYYKL